MRLTPAHIDEIRRILRGRALTDVSLAGFTSFRIGGPADLLVEPADTQDLAALLKHIDETGLSFVILGAGTNVLFSDSGFRGVVIRTKAMSDHSMIQNGSDYGRIEADAGVPLPLLVSKSAKLGWSGLEALWGIPGSLGGAVVTNAGAAGSSVADVIHSVRIVTFRGQEMVLKREELNFDYRSGFMPENGLVIGAALRLTKTDPDTTAARMHEAREHRRRTQPWRAASAGCVFKNPSPEQPAGALLDSLGFKGASQGDAVVSDVHANFIINQGNATAADVLGLIEQMRERVKKEFGIDLDLEIRVIGEA